MLSKMKKVFLLEYFHGFIPPDELTHILREFLSGTFAWRFSKNDPGYFVLVVTTTQGIREYRVKWDINKGFICEPYCAKTIPQFCRIIKPKLDLIHALDNNNMFSRDLK